jgi:hypothetical protein
MIFINKEIKKINTIIKIFYMLCLFNFIFNKKINCFIISIATTIILHFIVKKNIDVSMLISLMLSIFVFNCNKVFEYEGEDDEKDDKDDEDDEEDGEDDEEDDEEDEDEEEEEEEEEIDKEELKKAIAKAEASGIIEKGDSAKKQKKREESRLKRKFQKCATASLRPINECRQEINDIITGIDDDDDDNDDSGDSY